MSSQLDRKIAAQLRASADSLQIAANTLTDIARTLGDPTGGLITQAVERSQTAAVDERNRMKSDRYYRIAELAGAGLVESRKGVVVPVHIVWFLEEIYRTLGLDPDNVGSREKP